MSPSRNEITKRGSGGIIFTAIYCAAMLLLYIGERIGNGLPPLTDVAVDPVDGTRALAKGLPNAVSVVALAERGTLYYPKHIVYMDKMAVGPWAKEAIDITASVATNLKNIAHAKKSDVEDLTVVVLDRERHE